MCQFVERLFLCHCTLSYRCTSEAQCQYARLLSVNLSLFIQYCFLGTFSLDATLKRILLAFVCHASVTVQAVILRLTSDSVSKTHQMPRAVYQSNACHRIVSLVWCKIHCLRQVCRFVYQHIRLLSRLLSLQPCSHDECTPSSRVACLSVSCCC